jgi:dipeptidyl aminopeptidase/acylaminoacyl peptidase
VSAAAIKQQLQLIANRQISKKGGLSVQRPMPSSRAPAVSEMTRLSIYSGHSSEVHNVVWSPDGKSITSVSQDGIMQVWDAITAKTFFTYTGLRAQIYAVSVLINRKFAIAMSLDKTIQVLLNLDVSQSSMIYAPRRSSGGNLITYSGHSDTVQAITWSPNGKYIASGGNDKTVQVWDAISRQKVSIYTGHSQPIHAIAWSPDGTSIASGSSDALVQIWDSTEGDTILSYQKHSAQLTAIAWSPDGASIASGSHDRIMHIWNAPTGNTTLIYSGHPEGIHAIAWSPDGKYVASASSSVHLLEVATGKVIGVYSGHAGRVNAIAWSKDGRYVASAGNDKTVHVWRVKVK